MVKLFQPLLLDVKEPSLKDCCGTSLVDKVTMSLLYFVHSLIHVSPFEHFSQLLPPDTKSPMEPDVLDVTSVAPSPFA